MKKALFTATVFGFLGSFERNDISLLQKKGFEVTVAAKMRPDIEKFGDYGQLDDLNVKKVNIDFPRSPLSTDTFRAYAQLKKLIKSGDFDIIHCHTHVAGILTRLAARKLRKNIKVVYTAHGYYFNKDTGKLRWLLFYPAEKLCSRFTDVLININLEDFELSKRKMKAKAVYYIPGIGINTQRFADLQIDREQIRKSLNVPEKGIAFLSVGELNANKNHELVIRSLSRLKNPDYFYFIAGDGVLKDYLNNLIKENGLENNVHLLGYRSDVPALCKACDVFCFPSKREGLPVSLMEAMACGLPAICTEIRGNTDLIEQNTGGYLCGADDIDAFAQNMSKLAENEHLRKEMGQANMQKIKSFDIKNVSEIMNKIYNGLNIN